MKTPEQIFSRQDLSDLDELRAKSEEAKRRVLKLIEIKKLDLAISIKNLKNEASKIRNTSVFLLEKEKLNLKGRIKQLELQLKHLINYSDWGAFIEERHLLDSLRPNQLGVDNVEDLEKIKALWRAEYKMPPPLSEKERLLQQERVRKASGDWAVAYGMDIQRPGITQKLHKHPDLAQLAGDKGDDEPPEVKALVRRSIEAKRMVSNTGLNEEESDD